MNNDIIHSSQFSDGTQVKPPENPLKEKWKKLYPSIPMTQYGQVCDYYSCMWCGRCPRGDYWEIPDEDKEVWNKYQEDLHKYYEQHGGLKNILSNINTDDLEKYLNGKDLGNIV